MKFLEKMIIALSVSLYLLIFYSLENQDQAFTDSLYLHQPVDEQQIASMSAWVNGHNMQNVSLNDQAKVVAWLNQYPPNRVSEVPLPNAAKIQMVIAMSQGGSVLIHYAEKKIIVQQGQYSYVLLDETPELTRFFENLIRESSLSQQGKLYIAS